MTGKAPSNNKSAPRSPLALLQALSLSLLEHLEKACAQSLLNAERQLGRLDEQMARLQKRIDKRTLQLDEAIAGGKLKTREKRTNQLAELQQLLNALQQDRVALLAYTEALRSEVEQTLQLGQGVAEVAERAVAALPQKVKKKTRKATPPLPAPVAGEVASTESEALTVSMPPLEVEVASTPVATCTLVADGEAEGAAVPEPAPVARPVRRRRRTRKPAAPAQD